MFLIKSILSCLKKKRERGLMINFTTNLDTPNSVSSFKIILNLHNVKDFKIKINFSNEFNRIKLNESIENEIEQEWKSRCDKNNSLFNGKKFRLHSLELINDSLKFNVGLTCYKDYLGTNNFKSLVEKISNSIQNGDLKNYLANPLGCGALVLTFDRMFLFIKRSSNSGEYALYYDRPGGYAEPELCEQEEDVHKEILYNSIVRELKEELNFDELYFEKMPEILGIILNCESFNTPNIQFIVK